MIESPLPEPLDLAPLMVSEFVPDVPPTQVLQLKPLLGNHGRMLGVEHADLDIDMGAPTRGELWSELRGQLSWRLTEYDLAADENLSEPAIQLKGRLHNLAQRRNDAAPLQDSIPCFECPGTLRMVILPYQTEIPGLGEVAVEEVPMLCRPDCGDTVNGCQGSGRSDACLNELCRQQGLPYPVSGRGHPQRKKRAGHEAEAPLREDAVDLISLPH